MDGGRVPDDFAALVADLERELLAALAGVDVVVAHNVCSLHKNLALTAALQRLNGRPGFPRLIVWHHDLAWTTDRYRAELHAATLGFAASALARRAASGGVGSDGGTSWRH